MNYFIEGVQGAGKSTLVNRLAETLPEYNVFREGDYNPIELAWCTYMTVEQYDEVLVKYAELADEIRFNTHNEKSKDEERRIVTYTRIITDIPGFHKDLEQYEIYNGRVSRDEFEDIILSRYGAWNGEDQIFECSIFQNIVENMILYFEMTDDEIVSFYKKLRTVIGDREFRICYLDVENVAEGIDIIRRERVDADGNEMWFPLMMEFIKNCPMGIHLGWNDEECLVRHLCHRKTLELRLLKEVFPDHAVILKSKEYDLGKGLQ